MRALVVSPTLPWPLDAGGRLRTTNLLRELATRHEVTLWCVRQSGASAKAEAALRALGLSLRVFPRAKRGLLQRLGAPPQESWFWSPALCRALGELRADAFDVVHVDELCQVRTLPERDLPPLVQHHHKLDLELAAQLATSPARAGLERERWRALERESVARTRQHVFCSAEDAARFTARHPEVSAHVVPSGVDLARFAPTDERREADHLLLLGSLDYEPNVRGLEHFLAGAWPRLRAARPNVRLSIVGRDPDRTRLAVLPAGVTLVGEVNDVRPWLARAGALVVPLDVGGGTRLKLVEAAAMGCPIVTTAVGAEGLAFADGVHLSRTGGIEALGEVLIEELAHPKGLARRAAAARELTVARYGWDRLAASLEDAWLGAAQLAASSGRRKDAPLAASSRAIAASVISATSAAKS